MKMGKVKKARDGEVNGQGREKREGAPRLIRGSLGPPECTPQMASRTVQQCCKTHDRDRPTDTQYATRSMTIGRIYIVLG